MDRLILVRHGETSYNADSRMNPDSQHDAGLSPGGEAAVRRLAQELAAEAVDLVATSPRLRARRTAELLAAGRDVPVREVADLAEIAAGSFEGGPVADFQAWVRTSRPGEAPPGGESVLAAAGRYLQAARALAAEPDASVVAVTHNLPLRMLVNAAAGADPVAGPLQRVPQATPIELSAAELDTAIAGLGAWIRARPAGGARCAPA